MYGNLNKHKVLSAMLSIVDNHNADFSIKMNYVQLLPLTNLSYKYFERAVFSLSLEQYLNFKYEKGKVEEIGLNHTGANAALTNMFKEKHDKIFWNTAKEAILVICNVVIVIVAVYALTKDNSELDKVKAEVKALQLKLSHQLQQLNQERQVPEINTHPAIHSMQDVPYNTKDSLKK